MPLAAARSLLAARPIKPVAVACAKKVPTPTMARPATTIGSELTRRSGRPRMERPSEAKKLARAPKREAIRPASGVVTIDGRNTK